MPGETEHLGCSAVPLLLLILFIAAPILELYVIIRVGGEIGVLPTLALLILASVLGTVLVRSQGRVAWSKFRDAVQHNRLPHKEVFDGAMIILGGALLLTPGFITDIFGIFFLLPPTRAILWRLTKKLVVARVSFGPRVAYGGYQRARSRRGAGPRPDDIQGTAHEVNDEPGQPGTNPLPPPPDAEQPRRGQTPEEPPE